MAQECARITLWEPPSLEELQNISKNPTLQRVHLHSEASAINYGRETCLAITWDVLNLASTGSWEPTVIISSQVHIHRRHIVPIMREFTPWKLANTTNQGVFFHTISQVLNYQYITVKTKHTDFSAHSPSSQKDLISNQGHVVTVWSKQWQVSNTTFSIASISFLQFFFKKESNQFQCKIIPQEITWTWSAPCIHRGSGKALYEVISCILCFHFYF